MEILIKLLLSILGAANGFFTGYGIEIPIVSSGSGLYENYVYKGRHPDNYISFNNELWRILSFESDGSIKIIKNESIGDMAFDDNGFNEWDKSSLSLFLNNEYYDSIDYVFRRLMKDDIVYILSMEEYLGFNSNERLCGNFDLYFRNEEKCYKSNYINGLALSNVNHVVWTSSVDDGGVNGIYYVGNTYFGDVLPSYDKIGVLPVVYLRSDVRLSGKGTLQKPYIIELDDSLKNISKKRTRHF